MAITSRLTAPRRMAAALAIAITPLAASPAGAQGADVPRLTWLAGCWELRAGARVTHEQWMSPLGGLMLGMARTVVRDTVREFEHTRIEPRNGRLTYVAAPSRQAEAEFPAIVVSDTVVVFENPTHDFPQRIIYRRIRNDSLRASIEGTRGGSAREIVYPFARRPCP